MAWLLLLVMLGGCAADAGTVVVPEGAEVVGDAPARAAWEAAGLPTLEGCPHPYWMTVSLPVFTSRCGPACADPNRPDGFCAYACTVFAADGQSWGLYPGPAPGTHPIPVLQVHEQMHSFEMCAFGDADGLHANPEVWLDAQHPALKVEEP